MPVASNLQGLRDRVVACVDRAFAEPVRHYPLKNGQTDAGRSITEFSAVLRVGGGESTNLAGGNGSDWRSRLSAGKAELHIDRVRYPALVVRNGDKFRAISRHGEPFFEVSQVDDRSDIRLVAQLGEA